MFQSLDGTIEYDVNDEQIAVIRVDGQVLLPDRSRKVRDYSTMFNWGFLCSDCQQLALAILLELTNDVEWIKKNCKKFENEVLVQLPTNVSFHLDGTFVESWAQKHGWKGNKHDESIREDSGQNVSVSGQRGNTRIPASGLPGTLSSMEPRSEENAGEEDVSDSENT